MRTAPELVVLLNEQHEAIGTAPKSEVHGTDTPLHLAFSCHLVNDAGELLVTRRALSKQAWPGVWTNSFCGHPAPDEPFADAIARRARDELGARITDLRRWLPRFRYRATDAAGTVENEVCPVFVARIAGDLAPAAAEVSEWHWIAPAKLAASLAAAPFVYSPWLRAQLPQLIAAGAFPGTESATDTTAAPAE